MNAHGIVDMDALQTQIGAYTDVTWPDELVNMHGRGLILTEETAELDAALRARLDDDLRRLHQSNGKIVRAFLKRHHGNRGTAEQWSEEVRKETADVAIVLLDIARREGFSLADAVVERCQYVWSRDLDHDPIGES